MENLIGHFEQALAFISKYKNLADCHLVDFFTQNLWETILPNDLRLELESYNQLNPIKFIETDPGNVLLIKFISESNHLNLKNNSSVLSLDEFLRILPLKSTEDIFKNDDKYLLMKDKKKYEVEIFTQVIKYLLKNENEDHLVIDVGAGKGYLSISSSQQLKVPVLAIDSNESRKKSAIHRQKLLCKRNNLIESTFSQMKYCTKLIDETTDYQNLVEEYFPGEKKRKFLLTGLHTCGSLSQSILKSFINSSKLETLFMVTCCYHLDKTNQLLTREINLSKNARMLAQQSKERTAECQKYNPTIFYRAVLQVFLKSLNLDVKVGRGAPSQSFPIYARWALSKVLNEDQIPSEIDLEDFYNQHVTEKWKMDVFQHLRIHLGSIIETAIILDRFLFLNESQVCSRMFLTQLFDPLISPRGYAIVAFK